MKRDHGLTKGEVRHAATYLSFASLLGVADVLESIVHHGHFNHLGGGSGTKIKSISVGVTH